MSALKPAHGEIAMDHGLPPHNKRVAKNEAQEKTQLGQLPAANNSPCKDDMMS